MPNSWQREEDKWANEIKHWFSVGQAHCFLCYISLVKAYQAKLDIDVRGKETSTENIASHKMERYKYKEKGKNL
jgi:hypothetical protein